MVLPDEILASLRANGFQHTYTNEYSGTDRFIRKIRDMPINNRIYNNCAIVIETYAENFLTLNIFGYAQKTGFVQNITRDLFPGQYQFIPVQNINVMKNSLERFPYKWRAELNF